jgi:hypothetical protein
VVSEVVAWEPAALGVLPDAAALHAQVMAPLEAHLAARPGDWVGAYCVFLEMTSDGAADRSTPTVRRMARNAEAMLRDDARIITRHGFAPGELPADRVTVAVGGGASPLHVAIAQCLEAQLGRPTLVVEEADEHEVYLHRPGVLVAALAAPRPPLTTATTRGAKTR